MVTAAAVEVFDAELAAFSADADEMRDYGLRLESIFRCFVRSCIGRRYGRNYPMANSVEASNQITDTWIDRLRSHHSSVRGDEYEHVPEEVTQHHPMHKGTKICGIGSINKSAISSLPAQQSHLVFEPASGDRLLGGGVEKGTKRVKSDLMSLLHIWRLRHYLNTTRPDPGSVPIGKPLGYRQLQRLEEERQRAMDPGHFEQLTMDAHLVTDCLRHYNSLHLDDEYESAPGKVTRHCHVINGVCWTHGNFVARRKRSGCFSFLPAPRTLFFFELAFRDGIDEVVTCTPLLDEPVTEAYSVLGFPLWWSARRSGRLNCICKTCNRRLDVLHPDLKRTFACGHKEVESLCKMCYNRSNVLHPSPREFAFCQNSIVL